MDERLMNRGSQMYQGKQVKYTRAGASGQYSYVGGKTQLDKLHNARLAADRADMDASASLYATPFNKAAQQNFKRKNKIASVLATSFLDEAKR